MKKLSIIFILFWISILLMVIISSVSSQDPVKEKYSKQDSLKRSSVYYKQDPRQVHRQDTTKLTDLERKKLEYLEWQKRSRQVDKNMETLEKQSMIMDSLLGKPDTTKKIR